jgi:alpha-galactosidase
MLATEASRHKTLEESMRKKIIQQVSLAWALILLLTPLVGSAGVQDRRLAFTPPMGWNGVNFFGNNSLTEAMVRAQAHTMATNGMKAAGYRYVNLDASWDGGAARDLRGDIIPNSRFPDMKALGDYIHSLGLKFGVYSTPGPAGCGGGFTGSYMHELQDARTFASWGVDYLKYDYCDAASVYPANQMRAVYRKMSEALRSTSRPIVFSLCQYGLQQVWRWGASVGGNLWRTTDDDSNNYTRMSYVGFEQNGLERFAGPGHWDDPDMLEIGNGVLTVDEEKTQMSLWCILAAPLLAGNDLTTMSPQTLAILTNREVINVDQDPNGIQGRRVAEEGPLEVWMKPLADGSKAVGLFNRETGEAPITVNFSDISVQGAARVRDLWRHKDLGIFRSSFTATASSHGVIMIRVTPTRE